MGETKNILNPQDGSYHDEKGREVNSPIPAFDIDPVHMGDTELDRIKGLIRTEMSNVAHKHQMETFEEANDFDIDDPFDEPIAESRYMREDYLPAPSKDDDPPPVESEGGRSLSSDDDAGVGGKPSTDEKTPVVGENP